ncbi:MAG TPA: carboxypeptidase regulatory-like domain-containing protein, partial [Gemmatimonadaceae bacterium]
VGHAVMFDASSLRGTKVRATWQANFTQAARGIAVNQLEQVTDVDDRGRFVVCGPARDRPVTLGLFKGNNRIADTTVFVAPVGLTQQLEWRVAPMAITAESAILEGTVVDDASKMPIAGAEVAIPALQRAATTGVGGTFRLVGIPAGAYGVQVRHVGDEPITDSIRLEPKARVTRNFSMKRATVLDTVRTSASAVAANLRLFETHRAMRLGAYVTDSTLRLRAGQRLDDFLLLHIQELRILRARGKVFVVPPSSGRVLSGFRNASGCISTVYLDGELQWHMDQTGVAVPFSIEHLRTDDISAVEYYGPSAPVPAEYRHVRNPCGVLVLWSRSK